MAAKQHIALAVLLTALYSNAFVEVLANIKKCTLAPPHVHNGNFPASCRGAAAGTACTAVCKPGFSSDPLPTTTCKNGIWTTPTHKCMPSTCQGAPHALRNGHWQASCHDLAPGTTCTGICDMNSFWWYNKKGLPKSTCRQDGTWSNPDPDHCEKQPAQGCLASPSAPHSLFNCGATSPIGAVCTAACDIGSVPGPDGVPTATCKATSYGPPVNWGAVTGSCVPACLTNPPQPAHGVFACDSPTYPGTQCNATCNNGYTGAPSATCQADGTYSAVSGTCILIQCSGNPSSPPANSNFSCASPTAVGATCNGTCASGYTGSPSATCQANGTYSEITGTCTPTSLRCATDPGGINPPQNYGENLPTNTPLGGNLLAYVFSGGSLSPTSTLGATGTPIVAGSGSQVTPPGDDDLITKMIFRPNNVQCISDAVTNGNYFEFTVTPNPGVTLKYIRTIAAKSGATDYRGMEIRTSQDSYASTLAYFVVTTQYNVGWSIFTYSLPDITTATTFRFYGHAPQQDALIYIARIVFYDEVPA